MRLAVLMSLASPWSRDTALALRRAGLQVHVVDFDDSNIASYITVRDSFQRSAIEQFRREVDAVHSLGSTPAPLRYFVAASRLRNLLDKCNADVLLTLYGGGFAMMAYLSGFRPYAVYAVGSDVLMAYGLRRRISARALSCAGQVFANGGYLADKVRELAPKAHVRSLLLGIDMRRFRLANPATHPVRILCSRGFLPVYNNASVVEALHQLPADVPDFRLTFVSAGPQLVAVRTMADRLPPAMRDRVRFHGGVTEAQLQAELENSHVFVSMSRSDGTATSLLEALACGLLPILSDIPQNREWVDADNGILVPLDNPRALAGALQRAIVDEDFRARAALRNHDRVLRCASQETNMAMVAERLFALAGATPATVQVL